MDQLSFGEGEGSSAKLNALRFVISGSYTVCYCISTSQLLFGVISFVVTDFLHWIKLNEA